MEGKGDGQDDRHGPMATATRDRPKCDAHRRTNCARGPPLAHTSGSSLPHLPFTPTPASWSEVPQVPTCVRKYLRFSAAGNFPFPTVILDDCNHTTHACTCFVTIHRWS